MIHKDLNYSIIQKVKFRILNSVDKVIALMTCEHSDILKNLQNLYTHLFPYVNLLDDIQNTS